MGAVLLFQVNASYTYIPSFEILNLLAVLLVFALSIVFPRLLTRTLYLGLQAKYIVLIALVGSALMSYPARKAYLIKMEKVGNELLVAIDQHYNTHGHYPSSLNSIENLDRINHSIFVKRFMLQVLTCNLTLTTLGVH